MAHDLLEDAGVAITPGIDFEDPTSGEVAEKVAEKTLPTDGLFQTGSLRPLGCDVLIFRRGFLLWSVSTPQAVVRFR